MEVELAEGCRIPGVLLGVLLGVPDTPAGVLEGVGVASNAHEPAVSAVTPPVLQQVQAVHCSPSTTAE